MKLRIFIILVIVLKSAFSQDEGSEVEGKIGKWKIENGILISQNNKYNKLAENNWNVFYNLFPKNITQKYIKELILFSDGLDEKTGAVVAINKNNKEWQLMLDVADVNFRTKDKDRLEQSIYTMIHEFGHVISLNDTQVKPTSKRKQTKGEPYLTEEGLTLRDSYLNQFVRMYWVGDMLKTWTFIRNKYCKVEEEACNQRLLGFFGDNYTHFQTDYAATCPEEDLAESWTEFVLNDKRIVRPVYVHEQKVNFFYRYSKLIKYRKIIRKNLRKLKIKLMNSK